MSIRVAIRHITEYQYDRRVEMSPHTLRLRPAPYARTPIEAYSLAVEPHDHFINWQQDPYNNYLARLVFPEKARKLKFEVEIIANMVAINPFDFFLEESATDAPFKYGADQRRDLAPYLAIDERGPLLKDWVRSISREPRATIDFLVEVNQRLAEAIDYVVRFEPGVQSCEQTLSMGRGSCRDSAWLLTQIFRLLGLASRFVSGYLVQLVADQKSLDGPSGPTADFSDLHAWTEVYLPGAGWVGLDPTSGLFAAEGHIPLAAAPHYRQASPIEGATGPTEVEFSYDNSVERLHEDPRVTKPYDDNAWARIEKLGARLDSRLKAGDVRLTMGGEPTFVSIDDFELPEWNTDADGADKRAAAARLAERLKSVFAPQGLIQHTSGKWYPGEPLPRWALNLLWREDGELLWRNPELLAGITEHSGPGADHATARDFVTELARLLRVDDQHITPAFEDTAYYLWKEGTLPANVDPSDAKLLDPLERARLRRLFDGELTQPTGFVLPLAPVREQWRSGEWPMKRGHVFLLPGDSPMGLRLPLSGIPESETDLTEVPVDPMAPRAPLRPREAIEGRLLEGQMRRQQKLAGQPGEVRTALCTEVRDQRLHVFLPPVTQLESYVALINAIETTAGELDVPVIIEGYGPPEDPRLSMLQITPDPGVIEVNVHPAASWSQMKETTEILYREARHSRLTTEKFMLDGRHTGTGGGNHITVGGRTPADSPFLRRPHLLKSLLTLWQNHPSLSYLFSGLFIGPTSQAPRVDEGREDALQELETALAQIPGDEQDVPPWLIDRVLRHHLVDLTGNTHRAEFCIDKLYSPDHSGGRRGLVEFRAFEMPPHEQMSLAQQLLMQSLIVRSWEHPIERPLIRWGTQLHDRFMLPWFVWHDFEDVIDDLNRHDVDMDVEWFKPFHEFRFPSFGTIAHEGIELSLRTALEPWHVLGEESAVGATARYVDSSVERLEVEVKGFIPERYAITCNGYPLPMHPTGVEANYVAGVRFKAWAPPSSMHPRLGKDDHLVFDIVDRHLARPIGGCRYHVSHPGGRPFENFPVNARAAEARRLARFDEHGHSAGEFVIRDPHISPDMPFTLDLRRCIER
ncbi:MAG: transglutaminase family protein [Pseudomonadota bacterium]